MKVVQVIDDAQNCAYDLFAASERLFEFIFPKNTDIAFIEDVPEECPNFDLDEEFQRMWNSPINKKRVYGISGTLFYGLHFKSEYYPNRRESDLDFNGRSFCLEEAGLGGERQA